MVFYFKNYILIPYVYIAYRVHVTQCIYTVQEKCRVRLNIVSYFIFFFFFYVLNLIVIQTILTLEKFRDYFFNMHVYYTYKVIGLNLMERGIH